MVKLLDCEDPVRDVIAHAEAAPAEFLSWPLPEFLRRLRIRFGLKRKDLAKLAGVSASLIGRAEKGADIRLSTLRKIYAAVGCKLLCMPAGALYDMDWKQAHLDNDCIDWKTQLAKDFAADLDEDFLSDE
jgi:transcriptional regulator with XRE-family HTH domain